jgi:hypothetical protein
MRTLGWSIAGVLVAAAISWLWLLPSAKPAKRDPRTPKASTVDAPPADDPRVERAPVPRPSPDPSPRPNAPAACFPHATRACHEGDVYWLDSCGAPESKVEECGARLCQGDACEPSDVLACGSLPAEGVCDGDVVRGCLSGWPFERDCRALGKRCVIGDEGAVCRKPSQDDCDRSGPLPRCDGQKLLTCSEGQRVTRDCAAMDASCQVLPQIGVAACVAVTELARPPREHDGCGPCGCPETKDYTDEVCNGSDDDGDTWIDEGVTCEPLKVVAYVIAGGAGGGSYSRADIEQEIAYVDGLFAAEHGGLGMRVELAAVYDLVKPEYASFDEGDLGRFIRDLERGAIVGASAELRVPIIFTDEVMLDDAPKAGVSTLPNGHCGGTRRSLGPQPLRGLVAVSKRRAPTTVAHELGHFLGLCHTHEAETDGVVRVARWTEPGDQGFESTCDATCTLEGDGICDTPPDPGPELCAYDMQCIAHCATDAAPSTHNLMSYYTACRNQLTPLQATVAQRSRVLLEGFYRCADPTACPCLPTAATGAPGACPEQMSCRPINAQAFGCTLDGAFMEGERCRVHDECGSDLLCLGQRCARLPS